MSAFTLNQWCAWAPQLMSSDKRLLKGADGKAPDFIPKLLSRRLSPMARAVLNVATAVVGQDGSMPVVFSSAHGEICKSLEMLKTIQAGEELSPAAFSLSVHNAIAGLFSIALNNNQEITVLAPALEGIAPAFMEAMGMLHEGEQTALILLYDEPIAAFYPIAPFNLNAAQPCVAAMRVSLTGEGQVLSLERSGQTRSDGEQPAQMLAFLTFLLTQQSRVTLGNAGHAWLWRKH